MERKIKQPEKTQQYKQSESSRKPSYSEQTYRRNSQAGEHSSSQRRTDANLGRTSGTERKTTRTVEKDRLYPSSQDKRISQGPSSQQDKRISQGLSSSRPRSLYSSQPSWRQARRETSATSNLNERFSRLGTSDRRLRGGGEDTYNFDLKHKFLGVTIGSTSGTVTKEDSSDHQPAAETAAADTGSGETAAADAGGES